MKFRSGLLCALAGLGIALARAQGTDTGSPVADDVRKEIQQLRHELDSLKSAPPPGTQEQEDALDQLEASLDKRLRQLENKIDAVSRATAPVALNPRTTAFINFAARADGKPVYDWADPTNEVSNRPFLRTVELELGSAVDPYAEAVAILAVENHAGSEFGVDAEEAYGLIKRLPLIDDAPLGMKVKIGKFRAPIGVSNKIHMHDLPWTTRPLVVARYLGSDHGEFFESGFNPTGVDLDFYLPNPVPQTTLEMNLDAVRGGELGLGGGNGGSPPGWIAHLNLARDWNNEHLLVIGASTYQERGSASTQLYGIDLTYRWAPLEERESHSFVAGGEVLAAKQHYTDPVAGPVNSSPVGWFGYLQYQTSYWLYLGLRYDWLQEPTNDQLVTRSAAVYASYYTTEFLRFRIGLEHRWSMIPAQDNVTTGLFEVNIVFGSHPTEPYWVNR